MITRINNLQPNFMFIPQQDDEGSPTDPIVIVPMIGMDASRTPQFAVVDNGWASRSFPDNISSDYAYLVVSDVGSHYCGPIYLLMTKIALDQAVPALVLVSSAPVTEIQATALGYSGSGIQTLCIAHVIYQG